MTATTKPKVYPDRTLETELVRRGCQVRCLWQMPGPRGTMIAWMEGILVQADKGGAVIIVQTSRDGGWEAFTSNKSIEIEATVQDVIARVSA